jgi:translation initiation factor 2 beta subunit (eIF-2beta)/eIF-5
MIASSCVDNSRPMKRGPREKEIDLHFFFVEKRLKGQGRKGNLLHSKLLEKQKLKNLIRLYKMYFQNCFEA